MLYETSGNHTEPLAMAVALQSHLCELIREYLVRTEKPLSAQDSQHLQKLMADAQKHYQAIKACYETSAKQP